MNTLSDVLINASFLMFSSFNFEDLNAVINDPTNSMLISIKKLTKSLCIHSLR